MNPDQVARIRSSFDLLAPRAGELMDRFYERLFRDYPSVKPMFPADMAKQKSHLTAAVALVVKHADNLAALEKPLQEMGARHVGYGAQPAHYGAVRDTMVATLAEMAQAAWTPELNADWTEALNTVAAAMIRGAESVRPLAKAA